MEKSQPLFQINDKIKVLSGLKPLDTVVDSLEWDSKNNRWRYYFFDKVDGKKYWENDAAIEKLEENGKRQPFNMPEKINQKHTVMAKKKSDEEKVKKEEEKGTKTAKHETANSPAPEANENQENKKKDYQTFTGRVGADAKVNEDKTGKQYAYFTVAEPQHGSKEPKWHNVQIWEGLATERAKVTEKENVRAFLEKFKKGDSITLNGYVENRTYKDKEGKEQTSEEFKVTDVRKHTPKEDIIKTKEHVQNESNKVEFKGRLGADPFIKDTDNGRVAYFNVAENNGSETKWHNCKAVGDYIEKAGIENLKKGNLVTVKGFKGELYDYTHKTGEKAGQVEKRQDIYVGETAVIKHAETQEQKQGESQGQGISQ